MKIECSESGFMLLSFFQWSAQKVVLNDCFFFQWRAQKVALCIVFFSVEWSESGHVFAFYSEVVGKWFCVVAFFPME